MESATPTPDFGRSVRRPDRVVVRELDGEAILLNLDTERYFGLDEVGTRMWSELVAAPSIGAAFRALEREFDVEPDVLRNDLETLIARLLEAGLLELGTGEGSAR